MMSDESNRKVLVNGPTRRRAILVAASSLGCLALASAGMLAGAQEEISHTAEAIHQEPVFKASRNRVYEALTDSKQFDKVIELSGVMQAMHLPDRPAEISHDEGGAFALFGGHIIGRQIEIVPNARIVQAWRVVDWDLGVYSIAKFQLKEEGTETRIVFDHTGFPKGGAEHLAAGWKAHYWTPLARLLA